MIIIFRLTAILIFCVCALVPLVRFFGARLSFGEIVYQANRGDNSDIRLLDVRTYIVLPVTDTINNDEELPAWMPNGAGIVYSERSFNEGSWLHQIDSHLVDQGRLLHIRQPLCCPTWSPDGTRFAYMRSFGELIVRDIATDAETFLAYGFEPSWSPLDDQIAYHMRVQELERTQILMIAESDMNAMRQITAFESDSFAPQWSPDGRSLAFVSNRANQQRSNDLFVVEGDCLSSRECLAKTRQLTDGDGNYSSPTWSPDGQWLAFSYGAPDGVHLYMLHLATGERRRLTYDDALNLYPAWGRRG
jgi:TolB protein